MLNQIEFNQFGIYVYKFNYLSHQKGKHERFMCTQLLSISIHIYIYSNQTDMVLKTMTQGHLSAGNKH